MRVLLLVLLVLGCTPIHDGRIDPTTWDGDEDGFVMAEDCDDLDPTVHPDAEDWPYDGLDSDCSGGSDDDADGDGYDADFRGGDDCDDEDPDVHPGAEEVDRDGVDQNCTGHDLDRDDDGFTQYSDCDDEDPTRHPGQAELCDGVDQDCDGEIDESCG